MFMPYMYSFTVINVTPMCCTLWGRVVSVTAMRSLVAPCRCDNLWCRGVAIVTAPPLFNLYTQTNICIYIYAEFLTIIHVLISYLIGSEAKWPAFRCRRHFRMYFLKWKLNVFEKWSKLQHWIGYWLGAVQVTSHCLNQCWHSSSTHIYVWLNRVLCHSMIVQ